ncbi:MAG TPA: hypothetical protein VFN37_13685, partial [Candidatus Baltobacteraceae bacterium]|nr:hypothetical protein [Candidatus Baltobacteraceae bacterium]
RAGAAHRRFIVESARSPGRRILQRVAFEIVDLDRGAATAAQGVQAWWWSQRQRKVFSHP